MTWQWLLLPLILLAKSSYQSCSPSGGGAVYLDVKGDNAAQVTVSDCGQNQVLMNGILQDAGDYAFLCLNTGIVLEIIGGGPGTMWSVHNSTNNTILQGTSPFTGSLGCVGQSTTYAYDHGDASVRVSTIGEQVQFSLAGINDAVTFRLEYIKEIDAESNPVGVTTQTNTDKHTIDLSSVTFDMLQEYSTQTFQGIQVYTSTFSANVLDTASVSITLSIFDSHGPLSFGSQYIVVQTTALMISVTVSGWPFCDPAGSSPHSTCIKDGVNEVGTALDIGFSMEESNSAAFAPMEVKNSKGGKQLKLGSNAVVWLSSMAKLNTTSYAAMPSDFPLLQTQSTKNVIVSSVEKFSTSATFVSLIDMKGQSLLKKKTLPLYHDKVSVKARIAILLSGAAMLSLVGFILVSQLRPANPPKKPEAPTLSPHPIVLFVDQQQPLPPPVHPQQYPQQHSQQRPQQYPQQRPQYQQSGGAASTSHQQLPQAQRPGSAPRRSDVPPVHRHSETHVSAVPLFGTISQVSNHGFSDDSDFRGTSIGTQQQQQQQLLLQQQQQQQQQQLRKMRTRSVDDIQEQVQMEIHDPKFAHPHQQRQFQPPGQLPPPAPQPLQAMQAAIDPNDRPQRNSGDNLITLPYGPFAKFSQPATPVIDAFVSTRGSSERDIAHVVCSSLRTKKINAYLPELKKRISIEDIKATSLRPLMSSKCAVILISMRTVQELTGAVHIQTHKRTPVDKWKVPIHEWEMAADMWAWGRISMIHVLVGLERNGQIVYPNLNAANILDVDTPLSSANPPRIFRETVELILSTHQLRLNPQHPQQTVDDIATFLATGEIMSPVESSRHRQQMPFGKGGQLSGAEMDSLVDSLADKMAKTFQISGLTHEGERNLARSSSDQNFSDFDDVTQGAPPQRRQKSGSNKKNDKKPLATHLSSDSLLAGTQEEDIAGPDDSSPKHAVISGLQDIKQISSEDRPRTGSFSGSQDKGTVPLKRASSSGSHDSANAGDRANTSSGQVPEQFQSMIPEDALHTLQNMDTLLAQLQSLVDQPIQSPLSPTNSSYPSTLQQTNAASE